jgi:hypothetical protein
MDVPAIKPQPPPQNRPAHRAAGAVAEKRPARASPAHAAPHAAPARAAAHEPASPGDVAALAQQSAFDAVAAAQAEAQREWNVLRDLAMQQVKRDDQTVGEWIKLI